MSFQSKPILKKIALCIIIIVILLGLFYIYESLNENTIDNFTTFNAFYKGEPSPTGDYKTTKNTTYELQGIQAVTSNNIGLYALTDRTSIKSYSSSENKWIFKNINLNNPQLTNAKYDNSIVGTDIKCNTSDGLILTSSLSTLFMYDSFINNTNNVNCIYYMTLNSDGTIQANSNLYCLALPLLTSRIVPINTTPTSTSANTQEYPLQPFDNIRLMAANQNVLFALGCYDATTSYNMQKNPNPSSNDTGLYYTILKNGLPIDNTSTNWQSIGLPPSMIRYNINKMIIND